MKLVDIDGLESDFDVLKNTDFIIDSIDSNRLRVLSKLNNLYYLLYINRFIKIKPLDQAVENISTTDTCNIPNNLYCNCLYPTIEPRSWDAGFTKDTSKTTYNFCTTCKKEHKS